MHVCIIIVAARVVWKLHRKLNTNQVTANNCVREEEIRHGAGKRVEEDSPS